MMSTYVEPEVRDQNIKLYSDLQKRIALLVTSKTQEAMGSKNEKPIVTASIKQRIDDLYRVLGFVVLGRITYAQWKESILLPQDLLIFEDDKGSMAKVVKEWQETDFTLTFESLVEFDVFSVDKINGSIERLNTLLAKMQSTYSHHDELDKKIEELREIGKNDPL